MSSVKPLDLRLDNILSAIYRSPNSYYNTELKKLIQKNSAYFDNDSNCFVHNNTFVCPDGEKATRLRNHPPNYLHQDLHEEYEQLALYEFNKETERTIIRTFLLSTFLNFPHKQDQQQILPQYLWSYCGDIDEYSSPSNSQTTAEYVSKNEEYIHKIQARIAQNIFAQE